jgi:hypothetical protein
MKHLRTVDLLNELLRREQQRPGNRMLLGSVIYAAADANKPAIRVECEPLFVVYDSPMQTCEPCGGRGRRPYQASRCDTCKGEGVVPR